MPELPEVETIRRGLERTIVGKKIADVTVRLPKIVSMGPKVVSNIRNNDKAKAQEFREMLRGCRIISIKRRAKMLIMELVRNLTPSPSPISERGVRHAADRVRSRMLLLVHLKMTGQLVFAKKGEKKNMKILNLPNARREVLPHKYTHVIFIFFDGSRLYYNDMRQFGYLRLVQDEDLKNVRELAEYGPEPRELTMEYLGAKAKRRPKFSIKLFLMDPRVVAGIGNIYSDEILYWAGVRPARTLRSLHRPEFLAIFQAIPKVLNAAVKAQGSSVGDFFKVDGTEGRYGRAHMVYGRYGQRCKKCGTLIKSVKLGGRTGSFCPKCQQ